MTTNKKAIEKINFHAGNGTPFFFLIDFLKRKPVVLPLADVDPNEILYDIQGRKNYVPEVIKSNIIFSKQPEPFASYKKKFDKVVGHIRDGESYLLNLTCATPVKCNLGLKEIFFASDAKYKLWFRNEFVSFSPETFVEITGRQIETRPMKGTLDASIPNAERLLMEDEKETAEQVTVVDLLRNDLSIVAGNVTVEKFRYLEKIAAGGKELLQVSSKITGTLFEQYRENPGDLLWKILPAGSVSGAPKRRTVEIITETEGGERGYYTGIFGIYDGGNLDSGVLIRYIENVKSGLQYRSGGGITHLSTAEAEYQEMIEKIYVPIV